MPRRLFGWAAVLAAVLFAPANGRDRPGERPPPKDGPVPDPAWSFVTPTQSEFHVALVAKDWALVVVVPAKDYPYHTAELPLKKTVQPESATFHTGPDVWKYVRPPSGPPPAPIPEDGKYARAAVAGLQVTLTTEARGREPDAYVTVDLSAYQAGGKERPAVRGLKLPVRGPKP